MRKWHHISSLTIFSQESRERHFSKSPKNAIKTYTKNRTPLAPAFFLEDEPPLQRSDAIFKKYFSSVRKFRDFTKWRRYMNDYYIIIIIIIIIITITITNTQNIEISSHFNFPTPQQQIVIGKSRNLTRIKRQPAFIPILSFLPKRLFLFSVFCLRVSDKLEVPRVLPELRSLQLPVRWGRCMHRFSRGLYVNNTGPSM